MSTVEVNEKIEKACVEAYEKFEKLDLPEFQDIKEKLAFVINSYRYDKNPVGLFEIGGQALDILKKYKEEKPRQVAKKLIEGLEKAVAAGQN